MMRSTNAGRPLQKTQHLRDLNQHNGWLLEGQIIRNQQALEVLKPYKEPGLYGADGQTATARITGGKRFRFDAVAARHEAGSTFW